MTAYRRHRRSRRCRAGFRCGSSRWRRRKACRGGPGATSARPTCILHGPDAADPRSWLRAGQALSAVLLTAVSHGLAVAPITDVLEVAPPARAGAVVVGGSAEPYALIRCGYPADDTVLPESPRRRAEDVIHSRPRSDRHDHLAGAVRAGGGGGRAGAVAAQHAAVAVPVGARPHRGPGRRRPPAARHRPHRLGGPAGGGRGDVQPLPGRHRRRLSRSTWPGCPRRTGPTCTPC
jgi:hypothetical protein